MKKFIKNKNVYSVILSVVLSFSFVAVSVFAATTISTNISTGGTLTVTGASTMNGNVTLGNAAGDVILSTGGFQASSTALFGDNVITYANTTLGNAVTDSVTANAYFTQLRVGTDSTFGHIGTVGADELGVEGNVELDGTTWVDGVFHASSTALFGNSVTIYASTTISGAYGLTLGSSAANLSTDHAAGSIFYDSTNAVIKLFDGTDWFTVGTTTSGLTLSGARLQLANLTTDHMTFGTTTAQGQSMMTLEATTTTAIPLSLVAYDGATAHILNVRSSASADLLYVNSAGGLFGSSTAQFTGAITTYDSDVFGDAQGDTLTINSGIVAMGNLATTTIQDNTVNSWSIATSTSITPSFTINTNTDDANARIGINTISPNTTFEVVGTASSTSLIVGGDSTAGTIAGIVFGTCNLANTSITASSTVYADCATATGVTTGHSLFVEAPSLFGDFIIQSASSTVADIISLAIYNTGSTGTTTTSGTSANTTINFIGIK